MKLGMFVASGAIAASLACGSAWADNIQTFDLAWSGALFKNSASATGQIVLDLTTMGNPVSYFSQVVMPSWVQSVTVTVSGALAGNGTFATLDFAGISFDTSGTALDFSRQLVGQTAGAGVWGVSAGDFNLFAAATSTTAPSGANYLTLGANGSGGAPMALTSFAPAAAAPAVPEPAGVALLGVGLLGLGVVRRRRGVEMIPGASRRLPAASRPRSSSCEYRA